MDVRRIWRPRFHPTRIVRTSNQFSLRRTNIAKDQNTFAKRKREMDKKLKAEAKRARRNERKLKSAEGGSEDSANVDYIELDENGLPIEVESDSNESESTT